MKTLPLLLTLLLGAAGLPAAEPGLTKAQATAAVAQSWAALKQAESGARQAEMEAGALTAGGKTMKFDRHVYGAEPPGGHSIWISMHGGGGTTAAVNDSQYRNQIHLYPAEEGIWLVPRAPTDAWNMWHETHIDPLFDRAIQDNLIAYGANPNRVYILGYSAWGDGVYQLAPRMADRWAAAAMMAGHPNDASPLSLRNLPFAIFVGGEDAAYHRNELARQWGEKLDTLQKGDPEGYVHALHIYEGLGHWMNRKDGEALPWMAQYQRQPWPKKVIWVQDDVVHTRFYWLAMPEEAARAGQLVRAEVRGQTIEITTEGVDRLGLRLSDALLDLDRPVTVRVNGKTVHEAAIPRTQAAIDASLRERADPALAATASLDLHW